MAYEAPRTPRRMDTTISKPSQARTNAIQERSLRSEHLPHNPNTSLLRIHSHKDLEKGGCPGTRQFCNSSTASIATTQSTSSTNPKDKPRETIPRQSLPKQSRIARFLTHHYTTYRKIFTLIFVGNIAILIAYSVLFNASLSAAAAANAAAINLAVGVIFRQEQVVNLLFEILTSVPHSWPLFIRGNVAKVFHYGGVHSGCGVAAVAWFLLYTALMTKACLELPSDANVEALASAWILVALFGLLLGGAYPAFRMRYHNLFEIFHRFAGWSTLAAFWAHVLFAAHGSGQQTNTPMSAVLVRSVPFWCILLATIPIIASWGQLRKREVHVEPLSDHATRLRFDYADVSPCMGIRVSTNPMLEWHSFATIPNTEAESLADALQATWDAASEKNHSPSSSLGAAFSSPSPSTRNPSKASERGFSIVVSNAGDWTRRTIQSPPRALWIRGSPVRGVIYSARLFSRVVVVATGSGIGPCLSLLVAHAHLLPARPRVLWSAPNPLATFGPRLLSAVRRADPDAIVWDTRAQGRPDLCRLAEEMVRQAGAEAVFVISNPRVCKAVTTGLRERGIRAYAPIFDS